MDTIYALVIILSATLIPEDGSDPNLLSGEVEQKTTVYYKTLEACQAAHKFLRTFFKPLTERLCFSASFLKLVLVSRNSSKISSISL